MIDGQREVCLGEVVSFDMESSKIKVLFCRDGDVVHISKDNCIKIASTSAISALKAFQYFGQIKVGDNVARYFALDKGKSRIFVGEIIKCNSNSVVIRYNEDGVEEEVEMNEAWHLLKDCDAFQQQQFQPLPSQPRQVLRIALVSTFPQSLTQIRLMPQVLRLPRRSLTCVVQKAQHVRKIQTQVRI